MLTKLKKTNRNQSLLLPPPPPLPLPLPKPNVLDPYRLCAYIVLVAADDRPKGGMALTSSFSIHCAFSVAAIQAALRRGSERVLFDYGVSERRGSEFSLCSVARMMARLVALVWLKSPKSLPPKWKPASLKIRYVGCCLSAPRSTRKNMAQFSEAQASSLAGECSESNDGDASCKPFMKVKRRSTSS